MNPCHINGVLSVQLFHRKAHSNEAHQQYERADTDMTSQMGKQMCALGLYTNAIKVISDLWPPLPPPPLPRPVSATLNVLPPPSVGYQQLTVSGKHFTFLKGQARSQPARRIALTATPPLALSAEWRLSGGALYHRREDPSQLQLVLPSDDAGRFRSDRRQCLVNASRLRIEANRKFMLRMCFFFFLYLTFLSLTKPPIS